MRTTLRTAPVLGSVFFSIASLALALPVATAAQATDPETDTLIYRIDPITVTGTRGLTCSIRSSGRGWASNWGRRFRSSRVFQGPRPVIS